MYLLAENEFINANAKPALHSPGSKISHACALGHFYLASNEVGAMKFELIDACLILAY